MSSLEAEGFVTEFVETRCATVYTDGRRSEGASLDAGDLLSLAA